MPPSGDRRRDALVFAADEALALPLAVAIHSVLVNLSGAVEPELHVLDGGLSADSRERLRKVCRRARSGIAPHFTAVTPECFGGARTSSRFPAAIYARLLIPELLLPRIRRAVYLDADVLVRDDISPLFTVPLGDAPLAAVRDFLERPGHYFNSGVLVIDIPRWRALNLTERTLAHAAETGDLDQDSLNAVLDRWHELDFKWNVQHGNLFFMGEPPPVTEFTDMLNRQRWELYREAVILHFVGGVKPWHRLCHLPGTTPWMRQMLETRWLRRREAVRWLLESALRRSRYRFGTIRRRWWERLAPRSDQASG